MIGVLSDGVTPIGNGGHGIHLIGNATGRHTIGGVAGTGTCAGACNRIAANGLDGVFVEGASGAVIRGNSIEGNGGLGIDLSPDGVTPGDPDDADTGSNGLQNFPTIENAYISAGSIIVDGSLMSSGPATFTIDVYGSSSADGSGHGEGATHLGETVSTTNGDGFGPWSVSLAGGHPLLSATATDAAGNTSEFSSTIPVEADADGDGFSVGGGDCDPDNMATYPGAPEVKDGLDNQCACPPESAGCGFGVVDEITGSATFDGSMFCWPPQVGATCYQVVRSLGPAFHDDCVVFQTTGGCVADPEVPFQGDAHFYLVRSACPPPSGSWGQRSDGSGRTGGCLDAVLPTCPCP